MVVKTRLNCLFQDKKLIFVDMETLFFFAFDFYFQSCWVWHCTCLNTSLKNSYVDGNKILCSWCLLQKRYMDFHSNLIKVRKNLDWYQTYVHWIFCSDSTKQFFFFLKKKRKLTHFYFLALNLLCRQSHKLWPKQTCCWMWKSFYGIWASGRSSLWLHSYCPKIKAHNPSGSTQSRSDFFEDTSQGHWVE